MQVIAGRRVNLYVYLGILFALVLIYVFLIKNNSFEGLLRTLNYSRYKCEDKENTIHSFTAEIFNRRSRNIKTLWIDKDVTLSAQTSNWWYTFIGSSMPKEDAESLLKQFYKNGGVSIDPRTNVSGSDFVYKSCAVVGSSSLLAEAIHGELIDGHEAVFRFNNAPVEGYEKQVGFKTTHRILYPESASEAFNYNKDTKIVLVPFKVNDLRWINSATTTGLYAMTSYYPVPRRINVTPNNVWIMHPEFMRLVQFSYLDNPSDKWPSTGMLGVMLSLYYCESVSVFGFGANSKQEWAHYYNTKHATKLAIHVQHSASNEISLLKQMHLQKVITFHYAREKKL